MEVQGISYTPRPTDPNEGAVGNSSLGKEEFLRLLVTQLSNQDPLNPMDGQEFAAQLAQFSSVEQLINIDRTLADQGQMNALLAESMNNGVAAGLIGKTIEADGDALAWNGDQPAQIGYELAGQAESITVTIRDASGIVVRTMDLPANQAGRHTVEWDGTDGNGAAVSPGAYSAVVSATDSQGEPVSVDTTVRGEVDRVTFGADGIQLWIGSVAISMGSVKSVAAD